METNRKKRRKFILRLIFVAIAYCLLYCVLSMAGEYKITMSGEFRYFGGLAAMDTYKWNPLWVRGEIYVGPGGRNKIRALNLGGVVFAPLLWLDRLLVHKTVKIFEQSNK